MPIALLLSLLLTQPGKPTSPTKKPPGRILQAEGATLSAAEAAPLSGKSALALCGSELKKVKVTFKDPPPEESDPSEGPMKNLSVPCKASWLFYKVPQLKPGKVVVAFAASDKNKYGRLSGAPPISFSVGKKSYQVLQEGSGQFQVFLVDGDKRTQLFASGPTEGKDADSSLLLAGDLNRDGKPDVLLIAGGQKRSQTLFLSSPKGLRPVQREDWSDYD